MEQEAMSKEQFFEKLGEKLDALRAVGFDVGLTQGENPWSVSVSIGKEGAKPHTIDISMYAHAADEYEQGFNHEVFSGAVHWAQLLDRTRNGVFDEELFRDAISFAFEDLVKGADAETVSRRGAYLALKIREFASIGAEDSEEFAAAQLVAEALSAQACGGWQKVDGEVLTDKLVVYKDGERVLVDMKPCSLSALLTASQ